VPYPGRFGGRTVRSMDTISGLPAHPLLVHIPVVLVPLAALGAIVMCIKPAWHRRYRWAVLGIGVVGAIGAVLSASAGEALEEQIVAAEGRGAAASWEEHAEAGETARNFALLFMVVLIVFVFVPWYMERRAASVASATPVEGADAVPAAASASGPKWLRPVLAAAVVITGVAAVVTIVDAGHSGADSVWSELEGGEGG
jgi:uncharacterized membrane protein